MAMKPNSQKSSPAPEVDGENWSSIHNTPLEICREILCYLPAKSLVRFRSISKPWKSIIEEADFIKEHLQRSTTDNKSKDRLIVKEASYPLELSVFCRNTFPKISDIKFPPIEKPTNWTVVGARDGLLLLQNSRKIENATVILWNPSIQKFVYIPLPPIMLFDHNEISMFLGFDPSDDDYKVVTFVKTDESTTNGNFPSPHVFSLKSRSWAEKSYTVIGKSPHRVSLQYRNNVSIAEYIHWTGSHWDGNTLRCNLVSLNLTTMTILYTPMDDQLVVYNLPLLFGQNSFIGVRTICNTRVRVWVLGRLHYDPSWNKVYETELDILKHCHPLYLTEDGLLLLAGPFLPNDNTNVDKFRVYDLKTGLEKKFPCSDITYPIFINAYVESLVMLNWT